MRNNIPSEHYGVLQYSENEFHVEEVISLGFSVIDAIFDQSDQDQISSCFDSIYEKYVKKYSREYLMQRDELNTVRCPMAIELEPMFKIAENKTLLNVISKLIEGRFVLNQQNLIINPSKKGYNQGAWHRDLPYQHFVSSTPLSLNAIYCVDDFTLDNGASLVVPGSHRNAEFPSEEYLKKYANQVIAPAGSVILMDSMVFHSGGYNNTEQPRRAINQVYSIPFIKQQICLPSVLEAYNLSQSRLELIGDGLQTSKSASAYLESRSMKP